MALGVEVRRHLQKTVVWQGEEPPKGVLPPGKMLQYSNVEAWKRWVLHNMLWTGWSRSLRSQWVNESEHPDCVTRGLKGLRCFFRDFTAAEHIGELERRAQAAYPLSAGEVAAGAHALLTFKLQHPLKNQSVLPPLTYALSFAHLLRLRTSLQPSLREYYEARVAVVAGAPERVRERSKVLRVGMHLRRSDSCIHTSIRRRARSAASPINSAGQTSDKRHCYRTAVYIDALRKVCAAYRAPLVVYLATDDHVEILPEVRRAC